MDFVLQHYPFIVVMALLWLIGHFMERSVFTRERAFRDRGDGKSAKLASGFWYWARESMELHPVAAGAMIGLIWRNPENFDPAWSWQLDIAYFAGAGIASLFGWLIITKLAARFGIDTKGLTLPGESLRPPPKPAKPPEKE